MTKDDARQQFLRILKALPYGNSVFFSVRKIDDPIGLLPGRIILGINKRGVSFKVDAILYDSLEYVIFLWNSYVFCWI